MKKKFKNFIQTVKMLYKPQSLQDKLSLELEDEVSKLVKLQKFSEICHLVEKGYYLTIGQSREILKQRENLYFFHKELKGMVENHFNEIKSDYFKECNNLDIQDFLKSPKSKEEEQTIIEFIKDNHYINRHMVSLIYPIPYYKEENHFKYLH